jgi:hypothetical protein
MTRRGAGPGSGRGLAGLCALRAAWGAVLVAAPERALTIVGGREPARTQCGVVRVLGARQLLQAVSGIVRPTPRVVSSGAVADLLHGATCVAAVMVLPDWRRVAIVEGSVALGFAAAGHACARGIGRGI